MRQPRRTASCLVMCSRPSFWGFVSRMQAGVVWANTFNKFDPTSPFGGYKESGFGREGGMHGLHAYVRLDDR